MARVMGKVPSSKFQVPKLQRPQMQPATAGHYLELGIWNLEFLFSHVEVVIEPRRGPEFLLQLHKHPFVLQDVANLAVGIENVSELARARRAHFEARRIFSRARA